MAENDTSKTQAEYAVIALARQAYEKEVEEARNNFIGGITTVCIIGGCLTLLPDWLPNLMDYDAHDWKYAAPGFSVLAIVFFGIIGLDERNKRVTKAKKVFEGIAGQDNPLN